MEKRRRLGRWVGLAAFTANLLTLALPAVAAPAGAPSGAPSGAGSVWIEVLAVDP